MRTAGLAAMALLALAGCDRKKTPPADAGPPMPSTGLRVADKHLETPARLAIGTEGETSWRIMVSTEAVGCQELRKHYPERPPADGTRLDFWLARPIEPSGEPGPWAFRSGFFFDEDGERGLGARGALLDELHEKNGTVLVEGLELALTDFRREILWAGDLEAKSCGRVAREETDRPQEELSLRIGSSPIEVHGMSLFSRDGRHILRLSRAPHDCGSVFTEGYDLYVDLTLEGDPPKLALVSLNGDGFPETPSRSEGLDGLTIAIEGKLGDSGPMKGTLGGSADVRGYKLSVEGAFEALRCVEPGAAPAASSG